MMSLENRAKIFMPFAALKGYEEAIEEKQVEWEKDDVSVSDIDVDI